MGGPGRFPSRRGGGARGRGRGLLHSGFGKRWGVVRRWWTEENLLHSAEPMAPSRSSAPVQAQDMSESCPFGVILS